MHAYILDALYRPTQAIDIFESFIWTERFSEKGDFELTMYASNEARRAFTPGQNIGMSLSDRIMRVENIEEKHDDEGRAIFTAKGSSVESIFEDRIAFSKNVNATSTFPHYTYNSGWVYTGKKPVEIMYDVYDLLCQQGAISSYDILPNSQIQYQADRSGEPTDIVQTTVADTSLYDILTNLCAPYNLGFKLTRGTSYSQAQIYFTIYGGQDRTSSQTARPAVIFTPSFDNLKNTTKLTTISASKNVALVKSDYGTAMVYPADVSPDQAGFDRHVLYVETNDVDPADPDIQGTLTIIGRRELAKYRSLGAFDGEISQTSQYKYGRDYFLGDLVEIRGGDGVGSQMRVSEQIFVSDEQGVRSYPTLVTKTFINPGNWIAWPASQHWVDLDPNTTLVWSTAT